MKAVLVNTPKGQFVVTCEQVAHSISAFPIYYPAFLEDVKDNPVEELMAIEKDFLRRLVIQGGIPMNAFIDFDGKIAPLPPDTKWWEDKDNFYLIDLSIGLSLAQFTGEQTEVTC